MLCTTTFPTATAVLRHLTLAGKINFCFTLDVNHATTNVLFDEFGVCFDLQPTQKSKDNP